jgi:Cyclin, N-terminal domain
VRLDIFDLARSAEGTELLIRERCATAANRQADHHCIPITLNWNSLLRNILSVFRAAASAAVYFWRFFVQNDFRDHDPRRIALASLYLAAKAEECHVQAKLLFHCMQKISGSDCRDVETLLHLLPPDRLIDGQAAWRACEMADRKRPWYQCVGFGSLREI